MQVSIIVYFIRVGQVKAVEVGQANTRNEIHAALRPAAGMEICPVPGRNGTVLCPLARSLIMAPFATQFDRLQTGINAPFARWGTAFALLRIYGFPTHSVHSLQTVALDVSAKALAP